MCRYACVVGWSGSDWLDCHSSSASCASLLVRANIAEVVATALEAGTAIAAGAGTRATVASAATAAIPLALAAAGASRRACSTRAIDEHRGSVGKLCSGAMQTRTFRKGRASPSQHSQSRLKWPTSPH